MEILYEKLEQIPGLLIGFSPRFILALAIFFVGKFVLGKVMKAVHSGAMKIPNIDKTLAGFFTSTIHFAGMAMICVAALTALSIPLGFLATMVTALVVALGFALQGALGDLASGILIVMFRPYSIGDEVELNGTKGFVTDLSLFSTRMKTGDNVEIIVANGDAFGNTITNYFGFDKRRLDLDFGVSYDADLDKSIAAILSSTHEDARILQNPPPWAKVTNLGNSSVDIQLRVWCDPNDHRKIKMDIPYRVKKALDQAGIEIPYPHTVIMRRKA